MVLQPGDVNTVANGGRPVFIPPPACSSGTEGFIACGSYNGPVDIYDMALIATSLSPIPGDEVIAGIVWSGSKIVKLVLIAGAAIALEQTTEFAVGRIENGQLIETAASESNFSEIEWTTEMEAVFGGTVYQSTKHRESPLVLNGAYAATDDGKTLRNKGDGRSNGSIRMYAGMNGQFASVAILHIVSTQMNFLVLKGNVSNAGFCAVAASCLDLGKGLFMDTSTATWVAAWTMSRTLGKDTDPTQFLTVSQGWEAWAYYQAKYNLYTEVFQITLP